MHIAEKIFENNKLQEHTYKVSKVHMNDSIQDLEVEKIEKVLEKEKISEKVELVCSMDHNVPVASVSAVKLQNRLKRICESVNGKYIYGQGIGQYIITKEYDISGQIIVSNDEHICMVGAKGALGLSVKNDIKDILVSGNITIQNFDVLSVRLYGKLTPELDIFDIGLYLRDNLKVKTENTIIEFFGEAVKNMSLEEKMKLMCIAPELGAVSAIIGEDNKDEKSIDINLSTLKHGLYSEQGIVTEIKEDIVLEQGFVGGCMSNLCDFRLAAKLLKGKRISPKVKCIFAFPTNKMYIEAIDEGIVDVIMESGAILLNSGCGACWGGCQGKIGVNGVMITTATRMVVEEDTQKIYLGSVKDVIDSCIAGKLVMEN